MKIYNRKGFLWGCLWTVLGIWMFIIKMQEPASFLPKQIKNIIMSIFLFAVGITVLIRSFSKKASRVDKIEELDERNQSITLKCKAKTLDILLITLIIFITIGAIGYIITKTVAWGFFVLIPAILFNVYWITYIIVYVFYEKHE